MINDYWVVYVFGIVRVFRICCGFRTVKAFRIFIGKRRINNYWIESVFGIEYVNRTV